MKVRESALRWVHLHQVPDLAHLTPGNAGATHSRVDREMPRATTSAAPCLDLHRKSQRGSQSRRSDAGKLLLEQGGEDNDRAYNAEMAQLFTLRDGGNPITPRLQNIECPQCSRGTQSIGVRLDHGQQRYARSTGDGCSITLQRAKIDLDPGAS